MRIRNTCQSWRMNTGKEKLDTCRPGPCPLGRGDDSSLLGSHFVPSCQWVFRISEIFLNIIINYSSTLPRITFTFLITVPVFTGFNETVWLLILMHGCGSGFFCRCRSRFLVNDPDPATPWRPTATNPMRIRTNPFKQKKEVFQIQIRSDPKLFSYQDLDQDQVPKWPDKYDPYPDT